MEAVAQLAPPGLAVTVYSVIVRPPSDSGASQEMVAPRIPATAVAFRGASGTTGESGVIDVDADEGTESPIAFFAITVNV